MKNIFCTKCSNELNFLKIKTSILYECYKCRCTAIRIANDMDYTIMSSINGANFAYYNSTKEYTAYINKYCYLKIDVIFLDYFEAYDYICNFTKDLILLQ